MENLMKNYWIDVHTHLHMLKADIQEVLDSAKQQSVERLITVGTSHKDWKKVLEHINPPFVYGALGCHPHEARHYNDSAEEQLKKELTTPGIIALGEIGLDNYYAHSNLEVQKKVFFRQMEIAQKMQLPVEIHTRSAQQETLEVLEKYKGRVRGLLHCFTGTMDMAKKALDLGYNISFSGIITFKKAEELREVCSKVPLDRIHIETDAPYLAPVPFRGKENQPSLLLKTAVVVAEIHKIPLETLQEKTWNNAKALFPLLQQPMA